MYVLPEILKRFREEYPGIRVDVRTGTGRERIGWLRAYELDLVLAAMDIPPADLEFCPILDSEIVLITPEDHPLAGRESIEVDEVGGYPFIGHASTQYVRQATEVIMRLHGVSPQVVVEVDGWSVITKYVSVGMGISFVPDLCLTAQDRVWRIPFGRHLPPRTYGAITRRDGLLTLAAKQFLRVMAPNFPGIFEAE